jgi:hypothetical protein
MVIIFSSINAQEEEKQIVGKLFDKAEADSLYGEVLRTDTLQTEVLEGLLKHTTNYMMFKMVDGRLIVRNDNQATIYGNNASNDAEPFNVYSKSKIEELIEKGGKENTIFEMRKKVLTITNGNTTLELTQPCPPFCH